MVTRTAEQLGGAGNLLSTSAAVAFPRPIEDVHDLPLSTAQALALHISSKERRSR